MQITNNWPIDTLAINDDVQSKLKAFLLKPFQDENEARTFWAETSTLLIFIQQEDDRSLIPYLGDRTCDLIKQGMSFVEDRVNLTQEHQLKLAILSDDGSGIYLLAHEGNRLTESLAE